MNLVVKSAIWSFIIQVIAGIFLVMAFFYKLTEGDLILRIIVILELVVQVIEAIFYVFIIKKFASGDIDTSFRYYDWFFSTPMMLISTLLFLVYLRTKPFDKKESFKEKEGEKPEEVDLNVKNIFMKNKLLISAMVIFNTLMLVVGFMGENKKMGKIPVFWIGAVFMILSFGCLGVFAGNEMLGKLFTSIMFVIWAMYGVAFLMPLTKKNIWYNILDLFSKNFYGVFLYIVMVVKYGRVL